MTLNDIYLISQVLAVIALIPSVIYLAIQVRQNTLQARAGAAYQHFTTHNTMYELYRNKTLSKSQWHPIKKDILTVLVMPGARTVWDDFAAGGLSPDFIAYVEELLKSGEDSYSLDQLLGSKEKNDSKGKQSGEKK